jgi:AcrR family transcriptional regulator
MDETPAQRRARHRIERHRVLAEASDERRDRARELLATQQAERQEAKARGRSRRAPAMSVEDRRATIVAAALPLLADHGAAVTTSQIAAAAGIAEGTVFRAFRDKRELFLACARAAMRADTQVAEINGIPAQAPIAERLTEAMEIVSGYQKRLWSVFQAVRASGIELGHGDFESEKDSESNSADSGKADDGPPAGAKQGFMQVAAAIAEMLGAERDQLRTTPELAARLLLGLGLTNQMQDARFGDSIAETAEVVDLFLHGVLNGIDKPTGGRKHE